MGRKDKVRREQIATSKSGAGAPAPTWMEWLGSSMVPYYVALAAIMLACLRLVVVAALPAPPPPPPDVTPPPQAPQQPVDPSAKPVKSYSQYLQDRWVAADIYPQKRGEAGGFFVELGAYDGKEGSNTLTLEESFGWRGLCIEGDASAYKRLEANRPHCMNVRAIVTKDDGDMLAPSGEYDGTQNAEFKPASASDPGATPGLSLRTILRRANAPSRIDYFSLDVEGLEIPILESFPFDEYTVGAWTVEHGFDEDKRRKVYEMLGKHGYTLAVAGGPDMCSPHPELSKRMPQQNCAPRCPCVDDWYLHTMEVYRLEAEGSLRVAHDEKHEI